ncbi:hypothetical protein HY449_00380 [Candidatus Pacearchaeota archaeon]|nr:hypothetical protein [Candidatus Pacearchaeota archaeon]
MRKNLSSKTNDSERANLWTSVIKKGENPLGDLQLTDEMIEQIKKGSEKRQKRIEECAARGHPNSEYGGMESSGNMVAVSMYCNDCKIPYRRSPTGKEYQGFHDRMNMPIF